MLLALPAAAVLVLPFAREGASPPFRGVAVAETVVDEVAQANRDSYYTLLQLVSVLRRRDLALDDPKVPALAPELTALFAATDVITGTVKTAGARVEIEAVRTHEGKETGRARVEGAAAMLPVLGRQVAQKLLGVSSKLPPLSRSAQALELAAECEALAGAQPLGPRGRAYSLPPPERTALEKVCREALALDPQLGLARAGLSIALTLSGATPPDAPDNRFNPLGALATQFAARRAGKPAAARAILEDIAAARPGFLHALGYLGEERLEAHDDQAAVVAFDRYLARVPGQPWALAQKAHALSRLGRQAEAVAMTEQALAHAPGDPELQIELASRYLDDGNDAGAEPLLRKALAASPPRPVAALRLGYLELRRGRLAEAARLFQQVLATARRADEAPARALAHADLARVAARKGDLATLKKELDAARLEGLLRMPCGEKEFEPFRGKPGFAGACAAPPPNAAADPGDDVAVPVDL